MKKFIFPLVAVLGFAACNPNENPMGDDVTGGDEIKLTMNRLDVGTRAPYLATTPTEDAALLARVLCFTAPDTFKGEVGGEDAATNGYMNFVNGGATGFCNVTTAATPKYFPSGVDSVYLYGLYPATEDEVWAVDTNTGNASFVFDGYQDIMAAPMAMTVKEKGGNGGQVGALNFRHKLTKIEVSVKAVDSVSANAWGEITAINLIDALGFDSVMSMVTLNLKDTNQITFSQGVDNLVLRAYDSVQVGEDWVYTYTDNPFNAVRLTTTATKVGYILCQPVVAAVDEDEYTLDVIAPSVLVEDGQPKVVPFSLLKEGNAEEFTGSTAGKAFNLVLTFSAQQITATATVAEWDEQGTTEITID